MAQAKTARPFAEFLTVSEAAEFLGVSPWTLRNWDNSGKLKPIRHPLNGYRIYRQQDLETLPSAGALSGKRHGSLTPHIEWEKFEKAEHFVQFYDGDDYLVESVSAYVSAGLAKDESVVVIATPEHRAGIQRRLSARGAELAVVARKRGRYVDLDAGQTLAKLMVGDSPDRALFMEVVGGVIGRLAEGGRHVRAFGEMVALLWKAGNHDAACQLEGLWNELGRRCSFTLYCAYPMGEFGHLTDDQSLGAICACHSRVIPTEGYARLASHDDQLREIASLQQKALALEAEIAKRAQVEQELSDFVENALEALHKIGPDGRILWANRSELELLGYRPEEYIGRHITEFHVDQEVIEELLAALLRGESLVNRPARLRCKDGAVKHVLISSNAYFEGGRFVYSRCFTRDVTETREAERVAAFLATIVETSDDAIVTKDLDGVIRSWNAGAERLFGYIAEETVGKSITLIIPPDRHAEEAEILARLRRGERVQHFESVRSAKDGRLVDVSLTISPIRDKAGHIIAVSKIARDITLRKQAESALKEVDRRKDEFLAILAHELRNPLAPLRNSLHILRMAGTSGPAAARLYEAMERQVVHLVRMVDDLLELSRVSRGKIELRKERVEIAHVIGNAVETSKPLIDGGGHRLQVSLPVEPLAVHGDPVRLTQIFANLLNNAAKYTNSGGRIDLTARCEDHEVVVSVSDTGIGIPRDMIHRVFDMFTRVENVLRRTQEGLGVGLSLVRTLVAMHGGTVEAHSAGLGQGSEFIVRLPLAGLGPDDTQHGKPAGGMSVQPQTAQRLLVVDDNQDSAETLGMLLKFLGADVQVVFDGPSALDAVRIFRPSMILLDIGMPEMDGYEVARQIRTDPASSSVILVALTGWGQEEDRRRSREAGFHHHLVKPVELDALRGLLMSAPS